MKRFFFKKYNRLINVLLTILGFSAACTTTGCEYGSPYATFRIKGEVRDQNTSDALPNIRVVMESDTGYTNEEGKFVFEQQCYPGDQDFPLRFKDVDGPDNGSYQELDTIISFTNPKFSGGKGWNEGSVEKDIDIDLKKDE
ncbi:MAG: hypothetical protein CSA96_04580 [Bacteroidetes bacterium]|nr:MAG: hypothetical protein CSA96_04580 [Bacteroidota bacterium]